MQKHERIFIVRERTGKEFPFVMLDVEGHRKYVSEREGVIVFTPEELKELFMEYVNGDVSYLNFIKSKGIL